MKYIVATDYVVTSGMQPARLYKGGTLGRYTLSAQGTYANMVDLAKELNGETE